MNDPDNNSNSDLITSSTQHPDDKSDAGFSDTIFFPVSEGKLIKLYILSFGLYGIYWFYKNWKLQQPRMDKKIYPVMRAIFSIFFTHSLFNRINDSAATLERKHQFNANILATFFVATVVIGHLIDRLSMNTAIMGNMADHTVIIISLLLFIVSTFPLATVQATVNRINNDMLGYLNHKYSLWNYLLMTLGAIFWLMLVIGLISQSMGLAAPD